MPLDVEKAVGDYKLVKGKVIDQCGSCGETQIDLSQKAFEKLAHKKTGVLPIVWTIISDSGKIYVNNKYEDDELSKLSQKVGLSKSYILESYSAVAKYMATHKGVDLIKEWPWEFIKNNKKSTTTSTSKKTTTSKRLPEYSTANREVVYNTTTRKITTTTTTTRRTTTTTTRKTTTTTTTRRTTTTTTTRTTTTTTTKKPITTTTTTTKKPITTTTTTTKKPITYTTTTKKLVNSTPANYVVNESSVISENNIEVPVNYLVSENSVVNNLVNENNNNQRKSPHTPTGIVKIQTSSIKTTTTTKMVVSTTTTTTEKIETTTTERAIPTTTTTTVTAVPTVSSTPETVNYATVNNDANANPNVNANPNNPNVNANVDPNINANVDPNINANVDPNINANANPPVNANQQNVYTPPPQPVNYGTVNNGANANPNVYTNPPPAIYPPPPTNQPIQYQQVNQNSNKKIDSAVDEGKENKSVNSAIPVVFGGLFAASVGIFAFVKRAQVSKITSRVANGVTRTLSRRRPQNRMMHQHGSDYNLPTYY